MRVFVAGATGVVGRVLVPLLVERGNEVTASTRTPEKTGRLRDMGAEAVILDALDADAMRVAVSAAAPEVVVHELTAIPSTINLRRFDEQFAETNRLRTEGTDHLISAAMAAGARRFVAQSYGAWLYERRGGPVKTEDDPLDEEPPVGMCRSLTALRHLESVVLGAELNGIVLRYGAFYGPGSAIGRGGSVLDLVRRRRFPIVGSGGGVWSFAHLDDIAEATAIAIERGKPGIYNIVDNEPAPVSTWLPVLAGALGAPPPRRVPVWLARPLIGDVGISMMTQIRGASNTKAKRNLDWTPRYASWRDGFANGLDWTV